MKHVAFFGGRERFPLLSTMRAADHCWLCVHLDWIPFRLIDNLRPSNPLIHHPLLVTKTKDMLFFLIWFNESFTFCGKSSPRSGGPYHR